MVLTSTQSETKTHVSAQHTDIKTMSAPETPGAAAKKKPCECCAERLARLKEQIRKARERSKSVVLETNGKQRTLSYRSQCAFPFLFCFA